MRSRFRNTQKNIKLLTYFALLRDTQTNYCWNPDKMWKLCNSHTHMSVLSIQEVSQEALLPHPLLISMRNHPVRREVPETAISLFPQQEKMSNFVKTCSSPYCFHHPQEHFADGDLVQINLIPWALTVLTKQKRWKWLLTPLSGH